MEQNWKSIEQGHRKSIVERFVEGLLLLARSMISTKGVTIRAQPQEPVLHWHHRLISLNLSVLN
jgi:hypothetical protein